MIGWLRLARFAPLASLAVLLAVPALAAPAPQTPAPAAPPAPAVATEYTLGPEDEIAVSVWLHPELDRKISLGPDGKIVLTPVGEIVAAGLTTNQLADRIGDRLSTFLRQTATVTVSVTKYLSRSVTVTGAVAAPGRYGFPEIPSLVDVLNAAGGASANSDLSRVQVIRREGTDRGTIVADVTSALRSGAADNLPKLKPGDTVIIQSLTGQYAPAPGDGFAVLGQVTKPGIYQAGTVTNLWLALAQAGGLTPQGDLARVKVVSISADGQQVATHDLKEVLKRGGGTTPLVHPGDVIYVPPTSASVAAKGWTGLRELLSLSTDLVNLVIIADYLDRNPKK
jgi:polysaccharide export outer membrane protein